MKGISFLLGFENIDYNTISEKLKKELAIYSEENSFEFGAYEDNELYLEGDVIKETRKEARAEYTKIKKQIKKILRNNDKNINLIENETIGITRY